MKFICAIFLFTLSFHAEAIQSSTEPEFFDGKTFTIYELMEVLKRTPVVVFRHCSFLQTPGKSAAFNDDLLTLPGNVRTIRFIFCKFSRMRVRIENPDTDIAFNGCQTEELVVFAGKRLEVNNTKLSAVVFSKIKPTDTLSIDINYSIIDKIGISHASIQELNIGFSQVNDLRLEHCTFNSDLIGKKIQSYDEGLIKFFNSASINDSLSLTSEWESFNDYPLITEATDVFVNYRFNGVQLIGNSIESLIISNCSLIEKQQSVFPIYNCKVSNLFIYNTRFGSIDFYGSSISKNFIFQNSSLKRVNLFKCELPASNVSGLSFASLGGNKLYVFDPASIEEFSAPLKSISGLDSILIDNHSNEVNKADHERDTLFLKRVVIFTGTNEEQIGNTYLFAELINTYSKLYKVYKERSDLQSSNGCYVEMKDLQTQQLRMEHKKNPTFKNYFRWQLSKLVKVYTQHGTDPILAISVSFKIIFIFAILYFFYPSDWDINSKSKLLSNYRTFIEKNDKGYFKPFMVLISGVLLSFVNAFTLSLNAYTTLGFGNIPTHGLARYACIVEGFIGWFMLSIFTAALLNQILA